MASRLVIRAALVGLDGVAALTALAGVGREQVEQHGGSLPSRSAAHASASRHMVYGQRTTRGTLAKPTAASASNGARAPEAGPEPGSDDPGEHAHRDGGGRPHREDLRERVLPDGGVPLAVALGCGRHHGPFPLSRSALPIGAPGRRIG
jgi:hypothetical protein